MSKEKEYPPFKCKKCSGGCFGEKCINLQCWRTGHIEFLRNKHNLSRGLLK